MSIKIVGIELSEQEAGYRPKPEVTTDIQSITSTTAGKIFIGVDVPDDNTLFGLQMLFDGRPVEIEQNEKGFGGSTKKGNSPYKAYAIDLPMRFVTVQELPHTIQFVIGSYKNDVFTVESKSDIFELYIPSETPVIDPKVSPADSD
ncbi:MAG TPA: hypothetical protein VN372_00065 [Methanospirillum sp.]|nr:hypothetical protein [Methanospirillum sp.]